LPSRAELDDGGEMALHDQLGGLLTRLPDVPQHAATTEPPDMKLGDTKLSLHAVSRGDEIIEEKFGDFAIFSAWQLWSDICWRRRAEMNAVPDETLLAVSGTIGAALLRHSIPQIVFTYVMVLALLYFSTRSKLKKQKISPNVSTTAYHTTLRQRKTSAKA
jgi:hypothetical protein